MSAFKSNMPSGTRQAALVALCLAACLLAWRGTSLLTSDPGTPAAAAVPADMQGLQALIEPVLGRNSMRIAAHTNEDGARSILILVDAPENQFHLASETSSRIETILSAATGFDPSRDRLQIQPFAFAPGTSGELSSVQLLELAALAGLTGLLGFLAFAPAAQAQAPVQSQPQAREDRPAAMQGAPLRALPLDTPAASHPDTPDHQARQLARDNPQRTASILKAWLHDGSAS